MQTSSNFVKSNTYTMFGGRVEVVVYRPILHDHEQKKREEQVKRTLAMYGREMVRYKKGGCEGVIHG